MKTFPANFTAEKDRKTGAAPVWILKCPFTTGTVYLSDMVFSLSSWNGGITTKSWVKEWGVIDEDISGDLSLTKVSDFSLEVIIDPHASPHIETILDDPANSIETTDIELYLWFRGLDPSTDPPQLMWVGNITDYTKLNELVYRLDLVDQSMKLNKYVGTLLNQDLFPRMDPADVGKTANIMMGEVKGVPCHAIIAGGVSTLTQDMSATFTGTRTVADGSRFPDTDTFWVKIGDEIIRCSGASATYIYVTARGEYNTTPAAHGMDETVIEYTPSGFTYLVADHQVIDIENIYVDGELVTEGVTKYPSGHGAWTTKAQVLLAHGPYNPNPEYLSPASTESNNMTAGNPSYAIDGDEHTRAAFPVAGYTAWLQINFSASPRKDTVIKQEVEVLLEVPSGLTITVTGWTPSSVANTSGVKRMTFTKTGGARTDPINFTKATSAQPAGYIYEVKPKKVYAYKISPGAGTAAKVSVGSVVTADVLATATNLHYPDMVIRNFLSTYGGWPADNFVTDVAALFVAKGYRLSVVINEYRTLKQWLSRMAFQCRCYFRFAHGKAYLLYRPDAITSGKTITDAMVRMEENYKTTVRLERSRLDEVINKINLRFCRDWAKSGNAAYRYLCRGDSTHTDGYDAASVTRYGEKERADLFNFDFVTVSAMARDLQAFYLARYKDRKRIVTVEVFLDNGELEFGDGVAFASMGDMAGEVQKVNITPGSGRDMRNDKIQLVIKEY